MDQLSQSSYSIIEILIICSFIIIGIFPIHEAIAVLARKHLFSQINGQEDNSHTYEEIIKLVKSGYEDADISREPIEELLDIDEFVTAWNKAQIQDVI